ncbi:MAG: hypothetical protein LBF68_06545 [Christensenellaceae bacterium]|nr:hypothetical protein [Christensenellaceae bacterium]
MKYRSNIVVKVGSAVLIHRLHRLLPLHENGSRIVQCTKYGFNNALNVGTIMLIVSILAA